MNAIIISRQNSLNNGSVGIIYGISLPLDVFQQLFLNSTRLRTGVRIDTLGVDIEDYQVVVGIGSGGLHSSAMNQKDRVRRCIVDGSG